MHLSGDGSNREASVAVVVVLPTHVVRLEVQHVGGARVFRILRGRPVVAYDANSVMAVVDAAARRRHENAVAIGANEYPTIDAIDCCPFESTAFHQLNLLSVGWHHPSTTPFHMGNVVLGTRDVTADVVVGVV